jgi:uncharacterized protein YbjQ (UPF0145 family)
MIQSSGNLPPSAFGVRLWAGAQKLCAAVLGALVPRTAIAFRGPMSDDDSNLQEQQADEEASLARLQAGGIPLSAQRRLRQLHQGGGAFTSDLSVADFALCHRLGVKPLSQVMGSSIYQVGYQPTEAWGMRGAGVGVAMTELRTISQAWNESRDRAFARLREEAECVGAAAVVGVDVRSGTANWAELGGYGAVEYVVNGTAVRREGHEHGRPPVLSELSVADYAKLLDAGVEPVGMVAWTSVFFVSWAYNLLMGSLFPAAPMQNFELTDVTQCFYTAREQVMGRIGARAQALGASGIVGVRVRHTTRSQTIGGAGRERSGMVVSFSAIGTAVREDAASARKAPPMMAIEMTS